MELREAIRILAKEDNMHPKLCKVISVDGDECSVEPLDGTVSVKARLIAKINTTGGIRIEPKINSDVLVVFAESGKYGFVIMCSEISKVEVKTIGKIKVSNAAQDLKQILVDMLQEIIKITVTASPGGGPTTTPINGLAFLALKQRLDLLLD